MAIDMEQFHQVFFEESLEGLDVMEQMLLDIGAGTEDAEVLNTIFRAAHSIKGGSGTFGFNEIADFTHVLETLLDEAREGKRKLTDEAVELLLKSCDCLRGMIQALQNQQPVDTEESAALIQAFNAMLGVAPNEGSESSASTASFESTAPCESTVSSETAAPAEVTVPSESTTPAAESAAEMVAAGSNSGSSADILMAEFGEMLTNTDAQSGAGGNAPLPSGSASKGWQILFVPEPQILQTGNEPVRIFRELASLGELHAEAMLDNVPEFSQLPPDECFICWTLTLKTDAAKDDVLEIFDWVLDECQLDVTPLGGAGQVMADQDAAETTTAEPAAAGIPLADQQPPEVAFESVQAPAAKASVIPSSAAESLPEQVSDAVTEAAVASQPATEKSTRAASAKTGDQEKAPAANAAASSIRVGIDKVDSLINLVGELVITQSMLSELGTNFEMEKLDRLAHGLEQLLQNTRELQESVMRIRMLPISFAFNRFPRLIRDLSMKTGKKVELEIFGENTELDKTVMEQISDPLVHLVRNAIDHGIETAAERTRKGKPEQGTIRLDAYHKGGNIVIEVVDDGKGLNPVALREKAIEKGVIDADAVLTEAETYDLIFRPGFSTAAQVSDISGRGVGMDVVKRNIQSLGGRIHIESAVDAGTTIRVHLPLTLAILDGQLVRVGGEVYVIPLLTIVESLQIRPENISKVAGNIELYRLREENVPIISVSNEFGIDTEGQEENPHPMLVVVEGDGHKAGLLVDDLLAQQQVVIKSLESNYRRVEGISGATILGDGSVSLILDVPGLIARSARRAGQRAA